MKRLQKDKRILPHCIVAAAAVLFFVFLYFFNASVEKTPLLPNDGSAFEKAQVVSVQENTDTGNRGGSQTVAVQLLSGGHKGETVTANNLNGYLYGAQCDIGTRVIVQVSEFNGSVSASVYNYDRGIVLYGLIALFLVVLWVIGRGKGLRSALALVFTLACIVFLYLPMLYAGFSPFFAAVAVVVLTTLATMYLIGGFSVKTLCAVLGTIAGVVVAGMIATVFGNWGHISGWNVEDIETLVFIGQNSELQIGGLLFSGILIATLGAVMDVSISVASAMQEIKDRTPSLSSRELFKSGINVGRDMMGTMSNTLILAFTGSSINTLVIYYSYSMSYQQILNSYSIGIEILQGLAGTLGVILTVPFVSAISAALMSGRKHHRDAPISAETQSPETPPETDRFQRAGGENPQGPAPMEEACLPHENT